ncbi:methyltransferase family protein [Paenibacillus cellulosilyticus]|uniref:Methyltransferase family protein n=1 Tax=Paenibacillus cellulosilyticus TaxID=375489 RepID=A0A2V2Z0C1_9BACL|nr:class I SAM-dependent methyltransferase [Paenibacillus cellulosilyticus]PWW08718.1 methyltransferase family protein [Paenibacillus cellulosilyticus]QKS48282.1 class I SAM-dependent methyltransferase [Paenibacillus cellulosilyticus]
MNSYYGELCTKLYETDKSIAAGKELEFYLSFVDRTNSDFRVLEPMCGNGRMLIPFMQNGVHIEGFDISEDMLQACREKARRLNLQPLIHHQTIEEFDSPRPYDLIMIPFGSFSLLPNELVDRSLVNMRAALKPDGKLLLTIILKRDHIDEMLEWTETARQDVNDECIVTYKKVHYDAEQSLLVTQLKYQLVREGNVEKTEIMDFPLRLYDLAEFESILKQNGFQHVQMHDVKDGYGEGTRFQVFECSITSR